MFYFLFSRVFSNKENVFDVITPNRTYYIQAASKVEMSEWIKAFKTVIRSIKGKSTVVSQFMVLQRNLLK